jgi:hypothetical protein
MSLLRIPVRFELSTGLLQVTQGPYAQPSELLENLSPGKPHDEAPPCISLLRITANMVPQIKYPATC